MNPQNFGSPWGRPRFSPASAARNGFSGQNLNQPNFSDMSPSGSGYGNRFIAHPPHNMSPYARPPPPRTYSPNQYSYTSTPSGSRGGTPSSSGSFHSPFGAAAANSTPNQPRYSGDRGSARGSGRGRGFPHNSVGGFHNRSFCSPSGGGSGDIAEYYHPAMLQDPWAKLQPKDSSTVATS